MNKIAIIIVSLVLILVVGLAGCIAQPAETVTVTVREIVTIDAACNAVDTYLYNVAKTSQAKRLLAEYKDNMWSCNSCVVVVEYSQTLLKHHRKHVYSEQDYEGWDVKEYIIQHIFDSEFEPGTEMLQQVLKSGSCLPGCGPVGETTYPVTWVVDRQTGAVTPNDGNALRVEAELMKS